MSTTTLVVVDTIGIQDYIFGSNRLRENIGGSHLVHLATEGWLYDDPDAFLPSPHNIENGKRRDGLTDVESSRLQAELLYAGGGNTVLLFREVSDAKTFTLKLSEKLLCEAPGLEAVVVAQPVPASKPLAQTMLETMTALAKKKADRAWSQPLLGLGVTAACRATGLAANGIEQEPGERGWLPLSAETLAKWKQNEYAKERLKKELGKQLPPDLDFPDQFDHLGRTEHEHSYIAVVHADGNGMGKLLKGISDYYAALGPEKDREYISLLRTFSAEVNKAGLDAIQAVVNRVAAWNQPGGVIQPMEENGKYYLSLRPLVYGGDDVTFVCDGRIGLKAAQVFLDTFGTHKISGVAGIQEQAKACAGVAIVKVHYPFARAYQLAEALCGNAKKEYNRAVQAIDWHLAQSGLFGELREIRSREYDERRQPNGELISTLLMRPVGLTSPLPQLGSWRTWDNLVRISQAFRSDLWPRNKTLVLREALREGSTAVEKFVDASGRELRL